MTEFDIFDDGTDSKKYLESPLNYTGSKFKLLKQIEFLYPDNTDIMYDLFTGGGSVAVNSSFKKIVANDIVQPLIEFYKILQGTPWGHVISRVKNSYIPPDNKESYATLRESFNRMRDPVDFFILCCSCTNNMMRFNKDLNFNQTWGQRHFNKKTEEKLHQYHSRIFENESITFISKEFDQVEIEDGAFVYLDPPYLITKAGYNTYWSKGHEARLYDFIDTLNDRGIKFALSNVCLHKGIKNPHMDRLMKYQIDTLVCNYDKVSKSGDPETIEILVTNYDN